MQYGDPWGVFVMGAADLIASLASRGITLTLEGASIRAHGTLADSDRAAIRSNKAALLRELSPEKARTSATPALVTPIAPPHPAIDLLSPEAGKAMVEHIEERAAIVVANIATADAMKASLEARFGLGRVLAVWPVCSPEPDWEA
jgi:hypothetical protein